MIASVQIADVGIPTSLGVVRKAPSPRRVPGLRQANVAITAQLAGSQDEGFAPGRAALVALWDDDAALDAFLASDHRIARTLADGWRVRLTPLRAHGSWPGLDDGVQRGRKVDYDGRAAVLTLARAHVHRIPTFLRTSKKAELALPGSPGLIWACGMGKPPFFATCSLWESSDALSAYAYGDVPAHPDAIAADRAKPFHRQSAFVRFRPYASEGHLDGKNPLAESWMARA